MNSEDYIVGESIVSKEGLVSITHHPINAVYAGKRRYNIVANYPEDKSIILYSDVVSSDLNYYMSKIMKDLDSDYKNDNPLIFSPVVESSDPNYLGLGFLVCSLILGVYIGERLGN